MSPQQQKMLYDVAMSHLHLPYVWGGGNSSDGLDCSGLAVELLTSFGAMPKGVPDANAQGLWDKLPISPSAGAFGDLVFYGAGIKAITHVGFCLDELFMLEAGGGSPACATRADGIKHNARVRIRPIRGRKDLVGFRRPLWP